jgi:shikimate dehydrogenase
MTDPAAGPRAGIIGWPVAHSLSPLIHRYWLAEHGLAGRYETVAVAPELLDETVARLRADGWAGFNVTVPHKETVMRLLDRIDPAAAEIGAVNTVVAVEGLLEGRNTDAPGFLASLRAAGPLHADAPAVVLGAGGAARAVVSALAQSGFCEIRIANRGRARAEGLARSFPRSTVWDWAERGRMLGDAGLLVNATSLGMTGQEPLDIDLAALPLAATVTDLVYRPLETDLLGRARRRGNPVVDGLGMLLHQAVDGFAAWFGERPLVTPALRSHLLAALEPSP